MIRIVAVALALGAAGAAAAQTSSGGTSPSLATAPPPPAATAPPRPITGPAARAPSNSTAPPAISNGSAASNTAAAPVAGTSSFTEAEARSRIEAHGYSNVTGLQKDARSIWRGTATKNGQPVGVALDYQGNVVTQ
jgi:hypothetical protein